MWYGGTILSSCLLICTKLFYVCPCQAISHSSPTSNLPPTKNQYFRLFTSPTFDYLFILLNLIIELSCSQSSLFSYHKII